MALVPSDGHGSSENGYVKMSDQLALAGPEADRHSKSQDMKMQDMKMLDTKIKQVAQLSQRDRAEGG